MGRTNASRLAGRRFGRLKVEAETEDRASNGQIIWMCRCRCGGTARVMTSNLTRHNTQSCGCWQAQRTRESNTRGARRRQ